MDITSVRSRFPVLGAGAAGREVVHADAPGGTQVVGDAIYAMADFLRTGTANAHGRFALSRKVEALCAEVREQVGHFLGTPADGVVFGPNMTTLTIHFARALADWLEPGDELVCTQLDHDANVSPWLAAARRSGATVRWVRLDTASGEFADGALADAVTDRTRLVAFPRASNALGTLVDPAPFVRAARDVGALTFMDAVHAAPHIALDRVAAAVDVLVCSPYKFFGPHAGLLCAEPALLADLSPDKVRPAPDAGPDRWQTGTANFEAIAGVGAAISYLEEIGMDEIHDHERALTVRFLEGLDALDEVHLHGPVNPDRRTPTFAVTVAGTSPADVARRLGERDIYVWDGHYYAVEPMRALGLLDRGGAVRVGFVHYHRDVDVDRVLEALADLAR